MDFSFGQTVPLVRITDPRGDLSVIEAEQHIPFPIKRIYYSYNVPANTMRGGHAHKNLHQLMIAMSGSFDVILDNGKERKTITLNRPDLGLYIGPMTWRELENFSPGAVCVVLASEHYQADDYIHDHNAFINVVREGAP